MYRKIIAQEGQEQQNVTRLVQVKPQGKKMMFSTSSHQMSIQGILAGRKHLSFHIQKISFTV